LSSYNKSKNQRVNTSGEGEAPCGLASGGGDVSPYNRPKKSLGQNFLIDGNYQRKIVDAVKGANSSAHILEIGPGQGALTAHFVGMAKEYSAIEKDRDLVPVLIEKFSLENKVIHADFLEVDLKFLKPQAPWIAAGNLPYNVASQIFIRLIEHREYFSDLFLMFQKEMALRFVALPRTKDYGLLSLWSQIYTDCKLLFHLPPTVFRPQPKVYSSFVHFKLKAQPLIGQSEEANFWPLMRRLFQQRRKTLGALLKKDYPHLNPDLLKKRAEELSVEALVKLYRDSRLSSS
jgi:16S rRNA (adenine1518-N6/adenine1519-N6)-dimethyltransferase